MYNKIYGNYGENLAKKHLKKAGYKILAMNYTKRNLEADIIALEKKQARKKRKEEYIKMPKDIQKEDVLVFVEVKSRTNKNYGRPVDAVNKQKQNNYLTIARNFFYYNPRFQGMNYRFDVIEVADCEVVNHIINAF